MAKVKGVIGIPTLGMVSSHFMMARAQLQSSLVISWSDYVVTDDLMRSKGKPLNVAAKKQEIAEFAVENGADWVLFLDDDVCFPPNTLLQLLGREKDIVGGVYWSKSEPPVPLVFKGHMEGPHLNWHAGDFIKVDAMGMGLTLVRTKVFKAMPKPWFSENYVYHELENANSRNAGTTEDIYFYKKARDYGFEVFCDTGIQALHYDKNSNKFFGLRSDMPQAIPGSDIKPRGSKLIADIGSGESTPYFPEGVPVTMDIREEMKPDIVCDVRKIPEPDCKYDICYSSHTLEHFSHRGMLTVLLEWIRILKVGGEIRIHVPNIEWACKNILDNKIDDYTIWVLYGAQDYPKNFHACGFTKNILQKLFENTGCLDNIKVEFENEGRGLYATARKFRHLSFESIDPKYSFKDGSAQKGSQFPDLSKNPTEVSTPKKEDNTSKVENKTEKKYEKRDSHKRRVKTANRKVHRAKS